MVDYTSPVKTTFELQRQSIEQGQEALEQTLDLPLRLGEAAVDGLESQESVQRNIVELQQEALHSVLDAVEDSLPGVETPSADIRDVIDDQYEVLLENHAELFENLEDGLDEGLGAYEDLSAESLEAIDELVEAVLEAQGELEDQSVEAAEQLGEQVEELQDQVGEQVEDVQDQIQDVSEQAAEAVEA